MIDFFLCENDWQLDLCCCPCCERIYCPCKNSQVDPLRNWFHKESFYKSVGHERLSYLNETIFQPHRHSQQETLTRSTTLTTTTIDNNVNHPIHDFALYRNEAFMNTHPVQFSKYWWHIALIRFGLVSWIVVVDVLFVVFIGMYMKQNHAHMISFLCALSIRCLFVLAMFVYAWYIMKRDYSITVDRHNYNIYDEEWIDSLIAWNRDTYLSFLFVFCWSVWPFLHSFLVDVNHMISDPTFEWVWFGFRYYNALCVVWLLCLSLVFLGYYHHGRNISNNTMTAAASKFHISQIKAPWIRQGYDNEWQLLDLRSIGNSRDVENDFERQERLEKSDGNGNGIGWNNNNPVPRTPFEIHTDFDRMLDRIQYSSMYPLHQEQINYETQENENEDQQQDEQQQQQPIIVISKARNLLVVDHHTSSLQEDEEHVQTTIE